MDHVGRYRGFDWKRQRICDVLVVTSRARWYFLYANGKATSDHFQTLRALKLHVDGLLT